MNKKTTTQKKKEKKLFELKLKGSAVVFIDWANIYAQQKKQKWEIDITKLEEYLFSFENIKKVQFFHGTDFQNKKSQSFIQQLQENSQFEVFTKKVKHQKFDIENIQYKEEIFGIKNLLTTAVGHIKVIHNIISQFSNIIISTIKEKKKREVLTKKIQKQEIESFKIISKLANKELLLNKSMNRKITIRKCDFDTEISGEMIKGANRYKNFLLFSGDGDFKYAIEEILKINPKSRIYVFSHSDSLGQEIWDLEKQYLQVNIVWIKKIKKCLIQQKDE